MNYRHAFHAGNFSDVLKHIVLARLLTHLCNKEAPFRVIDTHAGTGLYDLHADEASRTGEWREGVGRVMDSEPPAAVAGLIAPWRALCEELLAGPAPLYPGSPWLSASLARAQDRLVFCEKHPVDGKSLAANFRRERRAKVLQVDGWAALPGLLPPPERRGLVLIDPPFEQNNEFRVIADAVSGALRRWASGVYAIWYPVKGLREVEHFARAVAALPAGRILRFEINLYRVHRIDRLNGCGMIILNPPWRLDEELRMIGSYLAPLFAREGKGAYRVDWLREEKRDMP